MGQRNWRGKKKTGSTGAETDAAGNGAKGEILGGQRRAREGSIRKWWNQRQSQPTKRKGRATRDPVGAWMPHARNVLLEAAKQYNRVVCFRDFVALVEARADVDGHGHEVWMHTTLEKIAANCVKKGEPVLSALCVHDDGTVAGGYAEALRKSGVNDFDPNRRAAKDRLRCYRHYHAAGSAPWWRRSNRTRRLEAHQIAAGVTAAVTATSNQPVSAGIHVESAAMASSGPG